MGNYNVSSFLTRQKDIILNLLPINKSKLVCVLLGISPASHFYFAAGAKDPRTPGEFPKVHIKSYYDFSGTNFK
jgi:hypothetical protein